ncbi:MAG: glycine cleavage T C-terminal barrel domain-containing protein [Pseudomonadota bacterium]
MKPAISFGPRVRKSPFFDATMKSGASAFTIYNHMYMPVSYGDPIGEYERLINGVSMWDVAAERQVEFAGPDAAKLAQYLTPRNLSKHVVGQGKYVPICNHAGHILNDPILLKLAEDRYWLSIADSDMLLWVQAIAGEKKFDVRVFEPDVSPLAIQGPKAVDVMRDLFGAWPDKLKYFWFRKAKLDGIPLVVARSGWSKQGGFELYLLDGAKGGALWERVAKAGKKYGIAPGTPNYIERVESALFSCGADNTPDSTPFEVGLGKFCDLDQRAAFVGKQALRDARDAGPKRKLVGLFLGGRALPSNEHPWPIHNGKRDVGMMRVVAYSPRLKKNVAIAQVAASIKESSQLTVATPHGLRKATITSLPFI